MGGKIAYNSSLTDNFTDTFHSFIAFVLWCKVGFVGLWGNVPSIADGGALYHRSLIEKQNLKICKQNH